jgi:hypothetical protein
MNVINRITDSLPISKSGRGGRLVRYDGLCSGFRKGIVHFRLRVRVWCPPEVVRVLGRYLRYNTNPGQSCPSPPVRPFTDKGNSLSRPHSVPVQIPGRLIVHSSIIPENRK